MSDLLHQQHLSEVSKLRYFLMGVAASAIAFAIHETADAPLAWSLAPIGLATLAWGISFGAGVISAESGQRTIATNAALNQLEAGHQPADRIDFARERFRHFNQRTSSMFVLQMWALLLGAPLYVAGHIWHLMDLPQRSAAPPRSATPCPPSDHCVSDGMPSPLARGGVK